MTQDSSPRLPDETVELLARVRSGDEAASVALFARYAPRVRGLVTLRMGRSLLDAVDFEDIVQESLSRAFAKLDGFSMRSEGSFICWLSRFVDGEIRNARRKSSAGKRGGGQVRRRADLGITTLSAVDSARAAPSPSGELTRLEFDDELERALLGLPRSLREVVYCRIVLDLSNDEVADELGLASADSARALFSKAVRQLREELGA